jgi:hypothetical protein
MAEILVPLPSPLSPTTEVRSTLLCASMQSMRARRLFDAYLAELPPDQREAAQALTPGQWLPIERAELHYAACDRLRLEPADRVEIGGDVGHRIQQSLLSTIVRLTRGGGVTPWAVVTSAEKLRVRTWKGGGIRVTKLGPKDARLEWLEQPCARSPHFRLGFTGILKALCELYAHRAYVREEQQPSATTLQLHVAWA